jgi:hypothetical protein
VAKRRRPSGTVRPASEQEYLAAELGHAVDHEGEPIGIDIPPSQSDPVYQEFTHALWRQMRASRSLSGQFREMEREGLTPMELLAPGITEFLPTSTTIEELQRYKKKLLFRANVLEAMLIEAVAELKRVDHLKPVDQQSETDRSDG